MYQSLIDLFVRNVDKSNPTALREKYGKFAGVVGVVCNLILAAVKFIVGFITGSISIRADAINNFTDSITAIVSVAAFKIASKPADKKHPFGHARIEYIVSMLLSFFLLMVGVDLMSSSIDKIVYPEKTVYSLPVLVIIFLTVLFKIWLSFFYRYVSLKINSTVLEATAAESIADVLSTATVLAGAVLSHFTSFNLDGYAGVLVSLFLLFNALKILNDTKNHILGTAPDPDLIDKIRDFVLSEKEIIGIHDLCIHNYGPGRVFASFHAEVDGEKDIFTTHDAVDNVERGIFETFGINCTIHLDPVATRDERVNELKILVSDIVRVIHSDLSIHDFRIVPGDTHCNLIFDLLIPFGCKINDREAVMRTEEEIKKISENYYAVITVDRGVSI